MRLFVDEDLSPTLTAVCHDAGYDATCSRDRQMLGRHDTDVAELCLNEERVLVTNNAADFLRLAADAGVYSGLVFMPLRDLSGQQDQMKLAIRHIEAEAAAAGISEVEFMVNRVVEIGDDGTCQDFDYPPA